MTNSIAMEMNFKISFFVCLFPNIAQSNLTLSLGSESIKPCVENAEVVHVLF